MANDNRTSAQKLAPAGNEGQTSVGNPQNYQAGQDAILAAQRRAELAANRQAEAANRAATQRPGGENDILNAIPGVQYTALPKAQASSVKSRKKG